MTERGPIVCGTDLSAAGRSTVELAARLAAVLDVQLHLVYVTGALVAEGEPASEAERVFRERLKARVDGASSSLAKLRGIAEALGPRVETHLLQGRPWEALLAHADRVQPAVIAVGPHGMSGPVKTSRAQLGEWLLGSTADRVVRHARWPVLVGPREAPEHAAAVRKGRWIVAVDFSPQSRAALELAHALARPCEASILVLHAVTNLFEGVDPMGDAEPFPPILEGERARVAKELNGFVKGVVGEELPIHLASGEPSEAIAELASQQGAKLVVMGTHGRTGLSHLLLGSVAERTLRRSEVPVLVIPAA